VRTQILFCFVLLWALSDPGAFAADPHWVEFPALKEFEGKPVTLTGWLYRPEGNGPFPALVLLHGCSGMYGTGTNLTPSYRRWAETLRANGYVALLVDSFGPRGARSICAMLQRTILEGRERVEDAYASLKWLAQRPDVQPDRIGLMGWSHGGSGTLQTMSSLRKSGPGFRAAVAFYPGCRSLSQAKTPYHPYAPLLILIGEADDWTPAAPCVELAAKTKAGGDPVEIMTYPGAHHAFDRINLPVRYRPDVRNLSKPGNCCGATVGEHPEAREDAFKRTLEFFTQTLKN